MIKPARTHTPTLVGLALALLPIGAQPSRAEEPTPRGEAVALEPTFPVESLAGAQGIGAAASGAADGSFLVVWTSDTSAETDLDDGIQGRRFDPSGSPVGLQFQANDFTTSTQSQPAPFVHDDGSFVILWQSAIAPPGQWISARTWDSAGNPVGGELQVNTFTGGQQNSSSVAGAGDGRAIAVWTSTTGPESDDGAVRGRLLGVDGVPDGDELQVSLQTAGNQIGVDVAMRPDGSFLAVWQDDSTPGGRLPPPSTGRIMGRHFDALGGGSIEELELVTTGDPDIARVDLLPLGRFVVVWRDANAIHGARFEIDGTPIGGELEIDGADGLDHDSPHVATASDGRFVVTWDISGGFRSERGGGSSYGVRARAFDSAGSPLGGELEISTSGYDADVTSLGGDDFLVVWDDAGEILGRRIVLPNPGAIFADGFENGDATAWSAP